MSQGSRVAGSTHSWPAVNSRVTVHISADGDAVEEEVETVTRVEDVDADQLLVAAPRFAGDLRWAAPGQQVVLSWASERGACFQRFALAAVERQNVKLWRLTPVAPVTVQQRRRYVRAAVTGRAELEIVQEQPAREALKDAVRGADENGESGEQQAVYAGRLVDISEGGARLAFDSAADALAGRRGRLRAVIDGMVIDQQAAVLRIRSQAGTPAGPVEVQLHFVEPVALADHLRRYVLRAQIENRRRGER